MTHPDGEISFFNDAAFDIAPTLADVVRYADVIFAARQAQPIPAVIPAPSPVITATTAVISAGMTGERYHPGRDDVRAPSPPTRRPRGPEGMKT